jgi:hypothetical protein
MDQFTNRNAVTAPIAREPTAPWACGGAAAALCLSRRGARCDEVPAGAPGTEQALARCASAPFSLERPPPRTCSEEQSAPPRRRHDEPSAAPAPVIRGRCDGYQPDKALARNPAQPILAP